MLNKMPIKDKDPFEYSKKVERDYEKYLNMINKNIDKAMNNYRDADVDTLVELMQDLSDYSTKIYEWAKRNTTKMFYDMDKGSLEQWQKQSKIMASAIRKTTSSEPVQSLMREYIEENTKLIQSVPYKTAQKIQKIIYENYLQGRVRSKFLVSQIMDISNLNKNRAKLIARTETSKLSTGLTMVRSKLVGTNWYQWDTSADIRVRSSHKIMEGVLVNWNDPPSPERLDNQKRDYGKYHAGQTFNCRCVALPLVNVDDVSWPAKVYTGGQIMRVRKIDFINMNPELKEAA